jgi:hypothetical protein
MMMVSVLTVACLLGLTPLSAFAATKSKLLKNLNVTGTLEDGGSFVGKVTITEFSYDEVDGLLVSGVVKGEATTADGIVTDVKQSFSNVEATLASGQTSAAARFSSFAQLQAECQILFLDIGPIFLDLLGLQLDLSQITLDLTAVSGAGNLVGNLLCAVAGLLDPGSGLLTLIQNLTQLLDLLSQINALI